MTVFFVVYNLVQRLSFLTDSSGLVMKVLVLFLSFRWLLHLDIEGTIFYSTGPKWIGSSSDLENLDLPSLGTRGSVLLSFLLSCIHCVSESIFSWIIHSNQWDCMHISTPDFIS